MKKNFVSIERETCFKQNIALGINIAILSFAVIAFFILFIGLNPTGVFRDKGFANFKYFSIIINFLEAIWSIAMIVLFVLNKKKKLESIPKPIYLINYILTSLLLFVMISNVVLLMPHAGITGEYEVEWIITGSNTIFHFIIPILALSQFVFCLPKAKLNFKETLFPLIPIFLYELIYFIICINNIDTFSQSIDSSIDFYNIFVNKNLGYFGATIFWAVFVTGIAYGSSVIIYVWHKYTKMSRNKLDIILNALLMVLTFVGICWLFYNAVTNPDSGVEPLPSLAKRFYYFTNWSLFLMFIASTISFIYAIKAQVNKNMSIPSWVHIVKLTATTLCFITIFFELLGAYPVILFTQGVDRAWRLAFGHHLKLTHMLIPLISIFTYICVEHNNLKRRWCLVGASPLGIYCLIYMIILYAHIGDTWTTKVWWDVYSILNYVGYPLIWLIPIVLYGLSYLFAWILWLCNRKINITLNKPQVTQRVNMKK